jgi:streptogramin lyase
MWFANCDSDTVTRYPGGDPGQAQAIDLGIEQPFDLVDNGRHIFVTGAASSSVGVLNLDGTVAGPPITGGGLDHPFGIDADADGNLWVANSGILTFPCPDRPPVEPQIGSLTLLRPDGTPARDTTFTGGGLTAPWDLATDGDGNVWVANFAGKRIAHFCGTDTSTCPPGKAVGDPISPDVTGYFFDGLTRSTGIAVDPSGNVWVTNNWLEVPFQTNPGGHEIVAFVGMAAPVLVDPPVARPDDPTTPTTSTPSSVVPATPIGVDPRFTG